MFRGATISSAIIAWIIAWMFFLFGLSGCNQPAYVPPPRDFSSSVTVTTVNGYVQGVDVYLPRDVYEGNNRTTTGPLLSVSVSEEKELDELIDSLKTTISELEDAKSRMLIVEEEINE